ncbi:MAG: transglycosylase SLT domain-containing protein, partial [Burkholderiaceae bacterium]
VMIASETPEAARSPVGRVATGAIMPAPMALRPVTDFAMPATLTDLGDVPPASQILGYRDPHALGDISAGLAVGQWHSDAAAQSQSGQIVDQAEVRTATKNAARTAEPIAEHANLSADTNLIGSVPALKSHAESIDLLISNIDLSPPIFADEMTGSSDLIDLRHRQHKIADFLSRYYRRSKDDIRRYVRYAYESGQRNGVDPLLIIGIMCVESSLNPKATSHKGAKGLMQVLVAAHEKRFEPFGGIENAYDTRTSIEIGTRIIAGMIVRTGSVKKALKHYVGAANFRSDAGYGNKVIGMRDRVWASAHGRRNVAKPNIKLAIKRAEKAQAALTPVVLTARR